MILYHLLVAVVWALCIQCCNCIVYTNIKRSVCLAYSWPRFHNLAPSAETLGTCRGTGCPACLARGVIITWNMDDTLTMQQRVLRKDISSVNDERSEPGGGGLWQTMASHRLVGKSKAYTTKYRRPCAIEDPGTHGACGGIGISAAGEPSKYNVVPRWDTWNQIKRETKKHTRNGEEKRWKGGMGRCV